MKEKPLERKRNKKKLKNLQKRRRLNQKREAKFKKILAYHFLILVATNIQKIMKHRLLLFFLIFAKRNWI